MRIRQNGPFNRLRAKWLRVKWLRAAPG